VTLSGSVEPRPEELLMFRDRLHVGIVLLVCLFAFGCASQRWVRSEFESNDTIEVFLEHRVDEDTTVAEGFAHPTAIDENLLRTILAGLLYEETRFLWKKAVEPVFAPEEVTALAATLRRALALATSDQRVFFISHDRCGGVLFSRPRLTRGVAFVGDDARLNLAFSEINEERNPDDYAATGRSTWTPEPTLVTSSSRPLTPLPWFDLKAQLNRDEPYPLWAIVDLDRVRESILAQQKSREDGESTAGPAASGATHSRGVEAPPAAAASTEPRLLLTEKLKDLKQALEAGLISEKEYSQKRAELLEEF